jgi:hypothetical protein
MDVDKLLAAGRYAVTYAGGIVTALGLSSDVDPSTLQSGFDHLFSGIKDVSIGLGILMPVAAGVWGVVEQTLPRLIAKLHARAPAVLAEAVRDVAPQVLAKTVSEIPGVQVAVTPQAPATLQDLARLRTVPDVVSVVAPVRAATPVQRM